MQQLLMVLGWTCCCLQARRRARSPSSGSDEDAQVEDDSDFAEALAAEENWGRPQRRAAQNANKALKVWTRPGFGMAAVCLRCVQSIAESTAAAPRVVGLGVFIHTCSGSIEAARCADTP